MCYLSTLRKSTCVLELATVVLSVETNVVGICSFIIFFLGASDTSRDKEILQLPVGRPLARPQPEFKTTH
jgi:hypothetical protein